MQIIRFLSIISICLFIFSCASKGKYSDSELSNCDIGAFNQNESNEPFKICIKNYREINADIQRKSKQANDPVYIAQQDAKIAKENSRKLSVRRLGTKMSDYISIYGEPDNSEIINGEQVLWFDDPQKPEYVHFKNEQLTSIKLDRETINERSNQRKDAAIDEQKRIDQYRNESRERAAAMGQSFQESQKNMREAYKPKKPANVPDSKTTCKRDYLNNLVCETFDNE